MPRMTQAEYDAYQARRKASGPKPEQVVCHESVAEKERETSHPESIPRRVVRITSYRRRLLDFDNLAGGCKYFLDSCKYAGLIPDDGPECITLEVSQVRVKTKAEERTELEIIKL